MAPKAFYRAAAPAKVAQMSKRGNDWYVSALGSLAGICLIMGLALVTAATQNTSGDAVTLGTAGWWLAGVGVLAGIAWLAVQSVRQR